MTSRRGVSPSDALDVCDGISAREFDGEWVVLDLRGGGYFGIDELGGIIWRNLSSGQSPAAIAQNLAADYEVPEAELLRDVLSFVDQLVDRGLLRVKP